MTRLAATLFAALVLAGAGIGTGLAATVYGYTPPGAWFPPGAGAGSQYDHYCGPWVENTFAKQWSSYGLITFINTSGGWNLTKQGYGTLTRAISIADSRTWPKKLHCKNTSTRTYQGGCFGLRESIAGCL